MKFSTRLTSVTPYFTQVGYYYLVILMKYKSLKHITKNMAGNRTSKDT